MIYQRMANPRAHEVASQATDPIRCPRAEGSSIYWITQGLYLTYNCVPQYIWDHFAEMFNKSHWILQIIYRLKVCNRRAFALSRRCRVSRSCPRVSGETIGVFDWAIGTELIFWFWPFPIRLVPVTRRLLDRGHFILTGQKWLVT